MINQADIAVSKVLSELGILSEESKEKVCIIQDIAKVIKLMGQSPLTVDGFDMLYDSTISELELIQEVVVQQQQQIGVFTKMFYH